MPPEFVLNWLLTMGIMTQLSTRASVLGMAPTLPAQPPMCAPFLHSLKVNEGKDGDNYVFLFNSPGYESDSYPNNTDCIRVLQAPSPANVVSLDFREKFHIEPSPECRYDFLEIRDGPYGFSPGVKNDDTHYCGKGFPLNGQKILSSSQYLWLRFHSDKTIQHKGMKAVFKFVDLAEVRPERRTLRCREFVRLDGDAKTLTQDNFPQSYISEKSVTGAPLDCTFDFSVSGKSKVFLHYDKLEFRQDSKCSDAFLEIYDGFTVASRQMKKPKLCPGQKVEKRVSVTARLVFRVVAKSKAMFPRFRISVTDVKPGPCKTPFYDCGGGFCVAPSLRCNGVVNCPNMGDEPKGQCVDKKGAAGGNVAHAGATAAPGGASKPEDKVPTHYIILGSFGALLCLFILICLCITLRQRRVDVRNRKREELLRRSSEAQRHFQQQQHAAASAAAQQHQQQQASSQSPHSLRRDLHTPSSLEGNRLLEFTAGPGPGPGPRPPAPDTVSLGRLNKQNGAVLMGGAKGGPLAGPCSSTLGGAVPPSSIFCDPRTLHSSRVGKYLSVPNPGPGGPEEDADLCLDSPIEPIVGHPAPPHCKIHGEVYQREGGLHQPIIHRSDSAPSKAFFRSGSATPPPGLHRHGAHTPTAASLGHHRDRADTPSPPGPSYTVGPTRRELLYYQHGASAAAASLGYHPAGAADLHLGRHSPYYSSRAPGPAYSLHNLSSGPGPLEDDGPPCICRRNETLQPMPSSHGGHAPPVVRQASLGTPRSLRRKVYET